MKHTISHALGEVVTAERTRKGFSQSELARLSGLHRSYIGDVERGVRNISIENLTAIANAFGSSGSVLLRRMEKLLAKRAGGALADPGVVTTLIYSANCCIHMRDIIPNAQ